MATPTNLPAAFTVGQVLTSTQQNDLRGAFRVLQVVNGSAGAQQATSSSTLTDTTLTATITPQSSSSKVLVTVSQSGIHKSSGNTGVKVILLRGSTSIATLGDEMAKTGTTTENSIGSASISFLDSPATTSAITYKTQYSSTGNVAAGVVQHLSALSTITLMEISA